MAVASSETSRAVVSSHGHAGYDLGCVAEQPRVDGQGSGGYTVQVEAAVEVAERRQRRAVDRKLRRRDRRTRRRVDDLADDSTRRFLGDDRVRDDGCEQWDQEESGERPQGADLHDVVHLGC